MSLVSLRKLMQHIATGGKKRRVVFTNGVFDLIHVGHVEYLSKARALGDILVVGVNHDSSVRRLKGRGRPLQPARDRARIVAEFKSVDYVVLFSEDTPEKLDYARMAQVVEGLAGWLFSEGPQ
ncbi:MAG: adenylyltransferase/cytidyltransferase family protein [candidate division Zixibacteria bacterium]|nr:adenylyltransferase/cytidyltransferase family protein [candidate division Zixibacteria bacterium]